MYQTNGFMPQYYGAQRQEITKVSGKNGAEMYQMAPNSSALLLDETAPVVWLKTTDGAGYPSLTAYKITPYEPEKPVDIEQLEKRIARLEEAVRNEQSDPDNDGEAGSGGSAGRKSRAAKADNVAR